MTLVYCDNSVVEHKWIRNLIFPTPYKTIHRLSDFLSSSADIKFAFVAHRMHAERDGDLDFSYKVTQLAENSHRIFVIDAEMHPEYRSLWKRNHRDNIYWCHPGWINDHDVLGENLISWQHWMASTADIYKSLPLVLSKIDAYKSHKRFRFDALLGRSKPHRDFFSRSISDLALRDHFIMTYGSETRDDGEDFYARDYFIWEPGMEITGKIQGTYNRAQYHGIDCHISQIIPLDVYNDSFYSVVTETNYDNSLSFFTEKTAKPLIAKRLFVMFSGQYFLRNLRNLGFETFGSIVDESYDEISYARDRFRAALEQVQRLCEIDPVQVLKQVRPVLEHNHDLIMQTDWNQLAIHHIQQIINNDTETQ